MPRRTVVIFTCSLCRDVIPEGNEGDVASFVLTWGTGAKLHYDVCLTCRTDEPWKILFDAGETRTRSQAPPEVLPPATVRTYASDGYTCDVCRFTAKSPQGLGAHKQRAHKIAGTSKKNRARSASQNHRVSA